MKVRFSRAEIALFLIPVLLIPVALLANRWKVAVTPLPTPVPKPTPTPIPNFFRGQGWSNSIPDASRDGRRIITHPGSNVSPGLRFAVWNAQSGDLVRRFGLFRSGVGSKQPILSPDGNLVAFDYGGNQHDLLVLLDVGTGRQLQQWKKTRSPNGWGAALSNRYLATITNDAVRLYSVQNGALEKKFSYRARDYFPTNPNFSPDGKRLCWIGFAGWNKTSDNNLNDTEIVCFDVAGERKAWNRVFSHTYLQQVKHAGNGQILIARGAQDFKGSVNGARSTPGKVWGLDARTGAKLWEKNAEYGGNEIPVSPDGKWIALTLKGKNGLERISICEARTGGERGHFFASFTEVFWSADPGQIWTSRNRRVVLQNDGSWSAPLPIKPQFKNQF